MIELEEIRGFIHHDWRLSALTNELNPFVSLHGTHLLLGALPDRTLEAEELLKCPPRPDTPLVVPFLELPEFLSVAFGLRALLDLPDVENVGVLVITCRLKVICDNGEAI